MASGEFKLEIQGIKGLTRALKQYPKIAQPILQRAFVATQAIFAKHTLKDNPVPWRTGNLLQSFRFRTGILQARWFPTANYAPMVEFGRGFVFSKNGTALSWMNKVGGGYVTAKSGRKYYKSGITDRIFAKYSRPAKGRPFMQKIVDNSKEEVSKKFVEAMNLINADIAKETANG